MIYIDSSAYLAILIPYDNSNKAALKVAGKIFSQEEELVTSYPILGEVLTIGSQRYNRQAAIDYVGKIINSKTKIVLEEQELLDKAMKIFAGIPNKNVGWVDCYSFAIIKHYKIEKVFSFDADFRKFSGAEVLR